jgi:hypothetical protein
MSMTTAIVIEWLTIVLVAAGSFAGGWYFRGRREVSASGMSR